MEPAGESIPPLHRLHAAAARCATPGMNAPIRLGMLTPSSNTTLEPVTAAMLAGLPHVPAHLSRFRVAEIALTPGALAQFDDCAILQAAELLAHAKVDTIAWNGTSSGWLGFDADRRLCERIRSATGIQACTSMLALNGVLEARRHRGDPHQFARRPPGGRAGG